MKALHAGLWLPHLPLLVQVPADRHHVGAEVHTRDLRPRERAANVLRTEARRAAQVHRLLHQPRISLRSKMKRTLLAAGQTALLRMGATGRCRRHDHGTLWHIAQCHETSMSMRHIVVSAAQMPLQVFGKNECCTSAMKRLAMSMKAQRNLSSPCRGNDKELKQPKDLPLKLNSWYLGLGLPLLACLFSLQLPVAITAERMRALGAHDTDLRVCLAITQHRRMHRAGGDLEFHSGVPAQIACTHEHHSACLRPKQHLRRTGHTARGRCL